MSFKLLGFWEGENACQALLYGDGTGAGATLCQTVYCDVDDATLRPRCTIRLHTGSRYTAYDNMMTLDQCATQVHCFCTVVAAIICYRTSPNKTVSGFSPGSYVEPGSTFRPHLALNHPLSCRLQVELTSFERLAVYCDIEIGRYPMGFLRPVYCSREPKWLYAIWRSTMGALDQKTCEDPDSWLSDHAFDHLNSSDCSVLAIPPGSSLAHQQEPFMNLKQLEVCAT